jgi:hypothetical protein
MLTMVLGVMLGGLVRRVGGVQPMGVSKMGVVGGTLVFAFFVVLGRLAVMMGRLFVVHRSFFVMVGMRLGVHRISPLHLREGVQAAPIC